MAVPAADVLSSAVPAGDIAAAGRVSRTSRVLRSLEITIPAAVLLVLLFFCFIWPLVYPVPSPVNGSVLNSSLPLWSPGHILGTDMVGDDVMSRILYGGRVSFEVAAAVQAIGLVIGGLAGRDRRLRRRGGGGRADAGARRVHRLSLARAGPGDRRQPRPQRDARHLGADGLQHPGVRASRESRHVAAAGPALRGRGPAFQREDLEDSLRSHRAQHPAAAGDLQPARRRRGHASWRARSTSSATASRRPRRAGAT